ncbi:MAG: phospholipase D-like domain-containing protein [Alphaproteobacteria bacterium]|nr:phospholipase D-like domain-containing protein [Alphaproteobacteria bacterium]
MRIILILCLLLCGHEAFSYSLLEKGDLILVLDDYGRQKYSYNKYLCRVILKDNGRSFFVERFEKQKIDEISVKKTSGKRKFHEISTEISSVKRSKKVDQQTFFNQLQDQDDFITEEESPLLDEIEQAYALQELQQEQSIINTKIDHLIGPEAHHEVLKNTIASAQKNLLISSDSITFLPKDIYKALKDASLRGVKIYIYVNRLIDERVLGFLESISTIQQRNIHAKYLIADDVCVIIGSHNWFDFDHCDGHNRSFKISENKEYVNGIKDQIWEQIRYYGNVRHGNERSIQKAQKSIYRNAILEYPLTPNGDSKLSLLSSLDAHEIFFNEICQKAQHRIQIYSPFVTFDNAAVRLIEAVESLRPGVKIDIFIWRGSKADQLFDFIQGNPALAKRINVHELEPDHHHKTLIMDDKIICEGSFNWLSSSLSEESRGHNLDTSLVCEGDIAKSILAALN